LQTSAPHVSQKVHTTPAETTTPHVSQTTAQHVSQQSTKVPTVVISPHIQIVIQNIKYSQRKSNAHIDNLFRRLTLYNDEYRLYKLLTIARLHLRQHYNALFYHIKHTLEKHNTYDTFDSLPIDDKNYNNKPLQIIPNYIHSMHTLNKSIKKIEQSIQFIRGNHKYILLKILNKLKVQYQEDTQKLFTLLDHY